MGAACARPGGKGLGFKNHEASSIPWAGSANRSFHTVKGLVLVEATGRSPDRAACRTGSPAQPPGTGITRPMLFEPQALAPGPQPRSPGNVKLLGSSGKGGGLITWPATEKSAPVLAA